MTIAPSLLGEVTRYVADIRKAHELLGWTPQVPLDEGIPRAVAWFQEHRAAHPEEDKPVVDTRATRLAGRQSQPTLPSVLAHLRPDRVGQDGRRRGDRRSGSRRSSSPPTRCRSTAACRSSTHQDAGARLVGIWPLDRQGTVGEYQALAHAAIDEIAASGRTPVVVGGSGLWFQAALTDVELPADVPAGARARWERLYDRRGAGTAHRDPRAARPACGRAGARERPQARRPRARALAGGWHARAGAAAPLDRRARGCPPSSSGSTRRARRWPRAFAHAPAAMFEQGVEDEVRAAGDVGAAGARPGGRADAAARARRSPSSSAPRCASPPTSASGCAGSRASS